MAINLIKNIQENLQYPEVQKIDPNTQEEKEPARNITVDSNFAQAAIPTVLIALYKFSRTEAGNKEVLQGELSGNLLADIFGSRKQAAIQKVSEYTGVSQDTTEAEMEKIASESVKITRQNMPAGSKDDDLKKFLNEQRSDILKHLPAALQIGEVLNDDTIDDRTNKMEGPISNHLHWLEKLFASSEPKPKDAF